MSVVLATVTALAWGLAELLMLQGARRLSPLALARWLMVIGTIMILPIALLSGPAPELGDATAIFDTVLSQGLLVNRKGEWPRIGGVTTRADKASAELGGRIVEDRAAALAEALRRFDLASRDKE